jgi:hypothetical protein
MRVIRTYHVPMMKKSPSSVPTFVVAMSRTTSKPSIDRPNSNNGNGVQGGISNPASGSSIGEAAQLGRSISGSGGVASVRALMADSILDFQHKLNLHPITYVVDANSLPSRRSC